MRECDGWVEAPPTVGAARAPDQGRDRDQLQEEQHVSQQQLQRPSPFASTSIVRRRYLGTVTATSCCAAVQQQCYSCSCSCCCRRWAHPAPLSSGATHTYTHTHTSTHTELFCSAPNLLLSGVDGQLVLLNARSGQLIWSTSSHPALLASSHHEGLTVGKSNQLVLPALDGSLYYVSGPRSNSVSIICCCSPRLLTAAARPARGVGA